MVVNKYNPEPQTLIHKETGRKFRVVAGVEYLSYDEDKFEKVEERQRPLW
jgi:hypothetical protein